MTKIPTQTQCLPLPGISTEATASEAANRPGNDGIREGSLSVLVLGPGSRALAERYLERGHTVMEAISPDTAESGSAALPTLEPSASDQLRGTLTRISDDLPALARVYGSSVAFDVIAAPESWQSVGSKDRARAFRKMTGLLKSGGRILIGLRQTASEPDTVTRSRSDHSRENSLAAALEVLARNQGMQILKRPGVGEFDTESSERERGDEWADVVAKLPDDDTGALPLLRHVILRDSKSSTYKLALLRALARAADGAQGMATEISDGVVSVPLGLVALNWLRMFVPLISENLPQSPANRGQHGLGFVDRVTWPTLAKMASTDFRCGMRFTDERAAAVHASLRAAASTITNMPARYVTYPGSDAAVFPIDRGRPGRAPKQVLIERDYLESFGAIRVPLHLWRAMARFDAWIDPALTAEWTRMMESYALSQDRELDPAKIARAIRWHDPARDTRIVRQRVEELIAFEPVHCVWSGRRLDRDRLDVDHCLPWSAWPCDDLWNLLPSSRAVNQKSKREKLPSAGTLERSAERILDWWDRAWWAERDRGATRERFAAEARASLPISAGDLDLEDVFAGLQLRRFAIRADQQAPEWIFP